MRTGVIIRQFHTVILLPQHGAKYCDEYICLFVHSHVSKKHSQFFVYMLRVVMALFFSHSSIGSVDDVVLSHNRLYGASCIFLNERMA